MVSTSHKINTSLYVTEVKVGNTPNQKVSVPTNHVFCCDISGSMYASLDAMRQHLKNRIPDIVNKNDTVTIIVFSGHNECTTIKEMVHVNSASELKSMNDAIDRYMKAWGCTCFYDPVEKTLDLINKNKGIFNFIFLSDGGNNDCAWSDVINVLNKLQGKVGNATIIEYGYYADTEKLNEMAETLGGCKITAARFNNYTPIIEKALRGQSENKKAVKLGDFKDAMKYAQVVYFTNDQIHVVSAANTDTVLIPESVDKIYMLTTEEFGKGDLTDALYAMAYVSAGALRYKVVESILATISDTKFIEMYCNAYGKQKLFDFQSELQNATFDKKLRGEIKSGYKPNPKAYCVLDFMKDLDDNDAEIRVVPLMENYKRTTAKAVAKKVLTEDDKKKLASAKSVEDVKKLNLEGQEVKMTMKDKGYPMSDFVWNEDRANLSALLRIDVELTLPENKFKLKTMDSFIYRNFTIIKDGILNTTELPLIVSSKFCKALGRRKNISLSDVQPFNDGSDKCYVTVDISKLPIVNREYTHSVSCKDMTELARDILEEKFELKYLGYLKKQFTKNDDVPRTKDEKLAAWLAELGITDKGYSPKVEREKSGEFYMALTFKSTFDKMSTIPKIDDVKKKIAAKKNLTASDLLMKNIMEQIDAKKLTTEKKVTDEFNTITEKKLDDVYHLSVMKFGLILSRKWFNDRKGFEDNHAEVKDRFGNTLTIDYEFTETKQNV